MKQASHGALKVGEGWGTGSNRRKVLQPERPCLSSFKEVMGHRTGQKPQDTRKTRLDALGWNMPVLWREGRKQKVREERLCHVIQIFKPAATEGTPMSLIDIERGAEGSPERRQRMNQ
jgi:hypothetical protein